MLSPDEQAVYARLSVFRGGFRREAAEQVADASLHLLTSLVDKSLLHWEPSGRYQIHELLRQYAADRLARTPDQGAETAGAHGAYFVRFVTTRAEAIFGGRQIEASAEISADLDNIRAAWRWALAHDHADMLQPALMPLGLYYQFTSRYVEGAEVYQGLVKHLRRDSSDRPGFLALALVGLAWSYIRLGAIEQAQTASEESLALFTSLGFPDLPNAHTHDPALTLGLVASIRGDYAQAEELVQQALNRSHRPGYFWGNQQTAAYLLATIAFAQGEIDGARRYAEQAYAVAEQVNDRWFMAYCRHELGNIADMMGQYGAAQAYYESGYALREAFQDWEGMAVSLNHLGKMALHQGAYPEAQHRYQRSIEMYQKINDRGGLAAAFDGLGQAATGLQDPQTAQQMFSQGLTIAADMNFVPLTLSLLVSVGQLLCSIQRCEQAAPLLAAVAAHPGAPPDTQARARHLLDAHAMSPDDFPIESDLQPLVEAAQWELNQMAANQLPHASPLSSAAESIPDARQANAALVEPLTPREREVLHLLAEGLTNQAIADQLVVTVGTIKAHTNNIYGKLGVRNRIQAVTQARELNLL